MIDRSYVQKIGGRIHALEDELAQPEIAADPRKFRSRMEEHSHLRRLLEKALAYFLLIDRMAEARMVIEDPASDDELRQMAQQEKEEAEESLPGVERKLMLALVPPDPADSRNTIIEIRAGTGGEEAALFAADLYRMYMRYSEERGWQTRLVDLSESGAGCKEVVFSVEGQNVYRRLRYESGVHRVQRVPATEAQGRIHTSAATVAVLPEVDEIDEITVHPDEIRMDLYCASGPGGQKVNKTSSAVRLTHLASGIVVQSQDERSQLRNKERAMQVLKAKLLDHAQREAAAKEASTRKSQVGSGDRSERIRTYNFPQNRVTDHRIGFTLYSLDRFMEGHLDPMIEALQEHAMSERLKEQTDGPLELFPPRMT
jgi:peptide chain release factor 1